MIDCPWLETNLAPCRGGEIMELSADRARVELTQACFVGGCAIWKNIFGKQFAYHQVTEMFKPFDLVIPHVGICPREIVQKDEMFVFTHPNVNILSN